MKNRIDLPRSLSSCVLAAALAEVFAGFCGRTSIHIHSIFSSGAAGGRAAAGRADGG
jgi:hypothetical protein